MFIDKVRINAKGAEQRGAGACRFRRRGPSKAALNGGDGGHGGNVIVVADASGLLAHQYR